MGLRTRDDGGVAGEENPTYILHYNIFIKRKSHMREEGVAGD